MLEDLDANAAAPSPSEQQFRRSIVTQLLSEQTHFSNVFRSPAAIGAELVKSRRAARRAAAGVCRCTPES